MISLYTWYEERRSAGLEFVTQKAVNPDNFAFELILYTERFELRVTSFVPSLTMSCQNTMQLYDYMAPYGPGLFIPLRRNRDVRG